MTVYDPTSNAASAMHNPRIAASVARIRAARIARTEAERRKAKARKKETEAQRQAPRIVPLAQLHVVPKPDPRADFASKTGVDITPQDWRDAEAFDATVALLRAVPPGPEQARQRADIIYAATRACPALRGRARGIGVAELHDLGVKRLTAVHTGEPGRPYAPLPVDGPASKPPPVGPGEIAVYVIEPVGPNLTRGHWWAMPERRGASLGLLDFRSHLEELGWRRI